MKLCDFEIEIISHLLIDCIELPGDLFIDRITGIESNVEKEIYSPLMELR